MFVENLKNMKLQEFMRRRNIRGYSALARELGISPSAIHNRLKYDQKSPSLILDLTMKYGREYVFGYEDGEYTAETIGEHEMRIQKKREIIEGNVSLEVSREELITAAEDYPILSAIVRESSVERFDLAAKDGYLYIYCHVPFSEIARLPEDRRKKIFQKLYRK